MAVDKRCKQKGAASRVCSERNTTWENTSAEKFAKSKEMHARKAVCSDEFATTYLVF